MSDNRLTALDASFLEVESPTAHMHVGWAALFKPPAGRSVPGFEELREHIQSRLRQAPRYRQKLAQIPFGVNDPVWVDDTDFDVERHVRRAAPTRWSDTVDAVMSSPLSPGRPLWELWIADGLDDGRIGVIGKVHHCMVDGLAAIELAGLLLDPTSEAVKAGPDAWRARRTPDSISLMLDGLSDRLRRAVEFARLPIRLAEHPRRLFGLAGKGLQTARAVTRSLESATPDTMFNEPNSPGRHLASTRRPLGDLKRIKQHFGTSINDVLLAVATGGLRRFLKSQNQTPVKLKAMVPVSLRERDRASELGNQISFIFVDLPCDEPDPARRLKALAAAMSERKQGGEPEGAGTMLTALGYTPRPLQHAVSRMMAGPQAFNLVVSNIPGPQQLLYMLGCELDEVYPIVPIADQHAVSIGMTTVNDRAFFGIYADRKSIPDSDLLSIGIDKSIDELLALSSLATDKHQRSRSASSYARTRL
jgi:WS/DGAT/MGAT family acyltransferase